MKKIELVVHLFEDADVGIFGGNIPFNVELPEDFWGCLDADEQKEVITSLKEIAVDIIDPDGRCSTTEEIQAENDCYEELYNEELENEAQ